MKKVNLACCKQEPWLIVKGKTGVIYSNQTSGIMCHHPKQEGFLVPLTYTFWKNEYYKLRYFNLDLLCASPSRQHIQNWIDRYNMPLKILDKQFGWKGRIEEAWVNVKILHHKNKFNPLAHLEGKEAILTYQNSD